MRITSKNYFKILFSIMTLFIFVACNSNKVEYMDSSLITDEVKFILDREGNEVSIPYKTDRIISMAPSITEILVSIGLEDNIIAVDNNSIGIEGISNDIATFDGMYVDVESLVLLNPDIIFVSEINMIQGASSLRPLLEMGTFVTSIPTSTTINEIKEDIVFIGEVTSSKEQAISLVEEIERELYEINLMLDGLQSEKSVYFEISPAPHIYSFGEGVFLNEMLEILGVENIFSDQQSWISVSEEAVIMRNPDIILTNVDYIEDPKQEIRNRNGWDVITAVKEDNIFMINSNYSSRPNQNIIYALKEMAEAIHPELFGSYE